MCFVSYACTHMYAIWYIHTLNYIRDIASPLKILTSAMCWEKIFQFVIYGDKIQFKIMCFNNLQTKVNKMSYTPTIHIWNKWKYV